MLPNIGPMEIGVIAAIGLLFFGAKRIPEVAKSIGKSLNSFKQGLKEVSDDDEKNEKNSSKKP